MEGFSLADLKRQWPLANEALRESMLFPDFVLGEIMLYCTRIYVVSFLKDGRFTFLMPRFWRDLGTLIALKVRDNSQGSPFSHPSLIQGSSYWRAPEVLIELFEETM